MFVNPAICDVYYKYQHQWDWLSRIRHASCRRRHGCAVGRFIRQRVRVPGVILARTPWWPTICRTHEEQTITPSLESATWNLVGTRCGFGTQNRCRNVIKWSHCVVASRDTDRSSNIAIFKFAGNSGRQVVDRLPELRYYFSYILCQWMFSCSNPALGLL